MNEYHKIQTMFKRDMNKKGEIIYGDWVLPEFEYLKDNKWIFTEKVDGTNVRVMFDGQKISYGGKTDNANLPMDLVNKLHEIFDSKIELFKEKFTGETINICFYGEGYGAGIQKGGYYRPDKSFVLFDINVGGWWLNRGSVNKLAFDFGCEVVPVIGSGTLDNAIEIVKGNGLISKWGNFVAEGIVARPAVEMRTRRGDRIITKIKHCDFQ